MKGLDRFLFEFNLIAGIIWACVAPMMLYQDATELWVIQRGMEIPAHTWIIDITLWFVMVVPFFLFALLAWADGHDEP